MFNLFKKKKGAVLSAQAVPAAVETAADLEREIVVHAMPERFRSSRAVDAGQAKKTGLLILVVGGLFLVAVAAGFYYFLFVFEPAKAPPAGQAASGTGEPAPEKTETAVPIEKAIEFIPESGPVSPSAALDLAPVVPAVATSVAATSSEPLVTPAELVRAADSDGDGLADPEEALLGTNPAAADSDGDGYSDLAELNSFYNPAGPGKLAQGGRIKQYNNQTYNYYALAPASWAESSTGGYSTIFTAPDNQFFQIDVQPNVRKQSIADWYKEQFGADFVPADRLIDHNDLNGRLNWLGVKNEDGLTVYLTDTSLNSIITLNYNLGLGNRLDYPEIFNLLINGFYLGK